MSQQTIWLLIACSVIAAAYSAYVVRRVLRHPQFDERQRRAQVAIVVGLPLIGALVVHLVHYQIDRPSRSRRDGIVNQEYGS